MAGKDSRAREIMEYSFLKAFADDGTIDAQEFEFMKSLALADGVVDAAERAVLERIFARVGPHSVEPGVWADIERFCAEHEIDLLS